MELDQLISIIDSLEQFEFNRVLEKNELPDKKWEVHFAFKGQIKIGSKKESIIIGFNRSFPFKKPLFFLIPYNSFGFIPHVEYDGYICYTEDNIIMKSHKPEEIVEDALYDAIKTIETGGSGDNLDDFIENILTKVLLIKKPSFTRQL